MGAQPPKLSTLSCQFVGAEEAEPGMELMSTPYFYEEQLPIDLTLEEFVMCIKCIITRSYRQHLLLTHCFPFLDHKKGMRNSTCVPGTGGYVMVVLFLSLHGVLSFDYTYIKAREGMTLSTLFPSQLSNMGIG